jgi:DNA polymerase
VVVVVTDGSQARRSYLDAMGVCQWVRRDWQAPMDDAGPVAESAAETPAAVGLLRATPPPPAGPEPAAAASPGSRQQPQIPDAASLPELVQVSVSVQAPASAPAVDWQTLQTSVASCCQCELHRSRTQAVFGVGDPQADWMLVGEAPGEDEDRLGEPFAGGPGKLLDEMLRAVGYSRERVFIANTLKCRPPNNRDPLAAESACCRPWLERQIELVQPRVIMAVGRGAANNLLNTREAIGVLRGKVHHYGSIPLVVGYHPAYLLRSPSQKRMAWQDLLLVRRVLEAAN